MFLNLLELKRIVDARNNVSCMFYTVMENIVALYHGIRLSSARGTCVQEKNIKSLDTDLSRIARIRDKLTCRYNAGIFTRGDIMRVSFLLKLLIILSFALNSSAQDQGPLDLSLNLEAGSSYLCVMELNKNVVQTEGGRDQTLKHELLMSWRYDVIGTNDNGDINIKLTYTRIKVKQDFGFQSSEYDSDSPPDYVEPAMRGHGAVVGSELGVVISRKGQIIELQGVDAMLDKMIEDLDLPDSPAKNQMIASMRSQFGEDDLRQTLEQITGFYPELPVEPGDKWTSETLVSTGLPMKVVDNYMLRSRRNGVADIDVSSVITSSPDSEGVRMGPVSIFYDITGTHTGSIEVDESTGLPIRYELDMTFSGTVIASGIPDMEPQSSPIRVDGRTVVTFTNLKDVEP